MKKYELITTKKYKLILLLEESEFDYYTDVYIELTFGENKIIIFRDNLLELKNSVKQLGENIRVLKDSILEAKLGILLNEYYSGLYRGEIDENIVLDYQGQWIGEKYCWFINSGYATWMYKYHGKIIMRVTPIFSGFDEEYVQEYNHFIWKYKDIFREQLSLEQILYMKQIIFTLYDKLI